MLRKLLTTALLSGLLSAPLVVAFDRALPERDSGLQQPFRASGTVLRVLDGDSFVLNTAERGQLRVRLHAVDAPELTQAYSAESQRVLEELLRNRPIEVECYKIDRHGRGICRVYAGSINVGRELVSRGAAWHYGRYTDEQTFAERRELAQAEARARREGLGLWATPEPMPPWECRARKREMKPCR